MLEKRMNLIKTVLSKARLNEKKISEHAVAIIGRKTSEARMNEIRRSPGCIECPDNRTLLTALLECLDHRKRE